MPGKSNALLIAGRYGLPEKVLEKARKTLSEREAPVEDLIGELNERKARLDRAEGEIAALRKSLSEEKENTMTGREKSNSARTGFSPRRSGRLPLSWKRRKNQAKSC